MATSARTSGAKGVTGRTGAWLVAALLGLGCGSVTGVPDGAPSGDGADDGDDQADDADDADDQADDAVPADASPPDARPLPTAPPVANGQAAFLALGAPSFVDPAAGTEANRFRWAGPLTDAGEALWVTDIGNGRVLRFAAPPLVFETEADMVVGQLDFISRESGPTNTLLTPTTASLTDGLTDVVVAGERLLVVDGHANRVLIWNQLPTTPGAPADMVLGQTTFTGSAAGVNADQLSSPSGVWSDGRTLIVVDQGNHRALVWTVFPTENGQPADLVLGQSSFTSSAAPDPPTASSMNQPADVVYDGERLYIADTANNRIMGWNGLPTEMNQPADFFVGQPDGVSNVANAGAGPQNESAAGVHLPGAIAVAHGSLYVADKVNFRVVVWSPRPATTGEEADAVLGPGALDGSVDPLEGQGFTPRGLAVVGDRLYLSDSNVAFGTSRVLVYQLENLP